MNFKIKIPLKLIFVTISIFSFYNFSAISQPYSLTNNSTNNQTSTPNITLTLDSNLTKYIIDNISGQDKSPDLFYIIGILLGGGGIIAALVQWLRDTLEKKRERINQQQIKKLERIGKSESIYLQLASFHFEIYLLFDTSFFPNQQKFKDEDYFALLFFLTYIRYLQRQQFYNSGRFIKLGNENAERVLNKSGSIFTRLFLIQFGYEKSEEILEIFSNLNDKQRNIFQFNKILRNTEALFISEFKKWIDLFTLDKKRDLGFNSRIFCEVMLFELNNIFKDWYGKKLKIRGMNDEIWKFLERESPLYYDKLRKFRN
jgi:hypothetical protein